ncbi:hypothetical protein FRC03_008248, partial [Tulasnella sp. 419]
MQYAGDEVTIFKILLEITNYLFHETFYFPDDPIPYTDFHLHLLHLVQQYPKDSTLQHIIAELLCLCPDDNWVIAGETGRSIHAILRSLPIDSDDNDLDSIYIHGALLDKIIRNLDDIQFTHNTEVLTALTRYCTSLFRSSYTILSREASFDFLTRMLKTSDDGSLNGLAFFEAQISYVMALVRNDLLREKWDSSGNIIMDFFKRSLPRDSQFHWLAYFNLAGNNPGNTADDEIYRILFKTLEPQRPSNPSYESDRFLMWWSEVILLLWTVARFKMAANGWRSDIYSN